ncbi:MAG: hypothetical protein WAW79_13100 [Steroidobacteraceae bacterium]
MSRFRSGTTMMVIRGLPVALLLGGCNAVAAETAALPAPAVSWPGDAELEAQGARIGSVTLYIQQIFDPQKPGERKQLFQLADRWHVDTREATIGEQLLFRPGDLYSRRKLEETERNLRDLRFIQEPVIRATGYHDGLVDLEVAVHDVWTTNPGISFHRAGGSNSTGFQLEELNFLGLGKQLAIDYHDDVDRSSVEFKWHDPNVGGSRWRSTISMTDSDDGSGEAIRFERPFFSLDTRWSAGLWYAHDDAIQNVYRLGHSIAAYRRDAEDAEISYGWSEGLQGDWTRRWNVGLRREVARFAEVPDAAAPANLPVDRDLGYPFLRLEGVQDDFEKTRNLDQIARTEDLHFGMRYALELGWAAGTAGADRDAALLRAEFSRGFRIGSGRSLFLGTAMHSRIENGSAQDALLSGQLRFYRQTSPRSTFFASLSGDIGHELDADHELALGGEEGLRGYPLRYQTGSGRTLLTVEQRIYTGRSLWKLADIGGAVFFDIGRTWGDSAFGPTASRGLLKDIGFGLRLGSSRSALGNVLHFDLAFPLDGDRSISRLQFLVQTKRSF